MNTAAGTNDAAGVAGASMGLRHIRPAMTAALLAATLGSVQAQTVPVKISRYWCQKLHGSYSGDTCMTPYTAHPGACAVFGQLNVNDAEMTRVLNEVKSARVCLRSRVDEARINSLKLRAAIMGYVTAGNPDLEDRNDPVRNSAYRPREGTASYWSAVAYFLYQCVVETCTSK